MAHKRRKIRRLRGTRTVGYGQVGQHRKHGQKGGMGKAGGMGTDWTYTIKYDPNRFGKHTFRNRRTLTREINVVNVGALADAMSMLIKKGLAEEKEGRAHVDLEKVGYHKLLGAGNISRPIMVQVAAYSEVAKRKIEGAGGAIIVKE